VKQCSACRSQKPEEEFHYKNKSRGERMSYCKVCEAEKRKGWNIGGRKNITTLVAVPTSKVCSNCRIDKPHAQFNDKLESPDGKQYYCRECQSHPARGKELRAMNELIDNPRAAFIKLAERVVSLEAENKKLREQLAKSQWTPEDMKTIAQLIRTI
jgi:hypothetical protein